MHLSTYKMFHVEHISQIAALAGSGELPKSRLAGAAHAHSCFMAFANGCTGSVLRTSSLVSQARRACSTP